MGAARGRRARAGGGAASAGTGGAGASAGVWCTSPSHRLFGLNLLGIRFSPVFLVTW
jgi:hypothetical protein